MGAVRQCALRKSRASHVGFGSKLGHPGDARCMTPLPPESGRPSAILLCRIRAIKRHCVTSFRAAENPVS
jgi:hypothetical protein